MEPSILFGKQVSLNARNDKFLHKIFERVVSENSGKTAATDPEKSVSFGELNKLSNQLARWVQNNCPRRPGKDFELIAVRFEPNVDLIVTLMAILKSGNCYVPIAPDWPESRLEYIVKDSKPTFLITNKTDMRPPLETIQFDDLIANAAKLHACDNITDGSNENNATFAVMYTSGSTGLPKGVRLLHQSAIFRAQWQWKLLPYNSEEDVCAFKVISRFLFLN